MVFVEPSPSSNSREATLCLSPMEGIPSREVTADKIRTGNELYRGCNAQEQQASAVPPRFLLRRPRHSVQQSVTTSNGEPSCNELETNQLQAENSQVVTSDDNRSSPMNGLPVNQEKVAPTLTLEEREQAYEEARRRIFGNFKNPEASVSSPSDIKDIYSSSYAACPPRPARPRPYRIPNGHICSGKNISPSFSVRHVSPKQGSCFFISPACGSSTHVATYSSPQFVKLCSLNPPFRHDAYQCRGTEDVSFRQFSPTYCNTLPVDIAESSDSISSSSFYCPDLNLNEYSQQLLKAQSSVDRVGMVPNPNEQRCSEKWSNSMESISLKKRGMRRNWWEESNMNEMQKDNLIKTIQPSYDVEFPPLQ